MGKRKSKKEIDPVSGSAKGISHNPFAALSGLRSDLPEGESTTAAVDAPSEDADVDSPYLGKVVVRREKKGRAGKTVTRISGIAAAALSDHATRMKKALGCGATIEEDELVLLGSLVERAAAWLEAEGAKRVVRGS